MNCLKGYIGLRGCGNTVPISNRYVNSLPGVSLKAIDNMANSEQVTYAQVWSDIQDRAIADMSTKVASHFNSRFQLKNIMESIDLGEDIDTVSNQTAAAAEYRGFSYELKLAGQHDKPSALQSLNVQKIKVYLKTAQEFTVKIFDLTLKKQLYTKTVAAGSAVVGWNEVVVYQSFVGFRFFFCVDCTTIESVYQSTSDYIDDCCDACVRSIYGFGGTGYIRGAKSEIFSPYTVSNGTNFYGLSAEFSLLCSFENVVCKNLKTFELAYWYKLGEEIMVERLASPRLNLTTIDAKEAQDLRDYFAGKFETELKLVTDGINLDLNDDCLECNAPVTYQNSRM